jgi:hypothetical protein
VKIILAGIIIWSDLWEGGLLSASYLLTRLARDSSGSTGVAPTASGVLTRILLGARIVE